MKHLILSTVCILLCATGLWAQTLVDGIYYNFDASTQTASVTGQGSNKYSGDVTIPSTVTYNGANYSVTSIGDYAFYDCTGLTSITIPNSVTSIEGGAFSGCGIPVYNAHIFAHLPKSYSGKYSIPDGIETIVSGAFSNCSGLTSITIPNSVTSIDNEAFYGCI